MIGVLPQWWLILCGVLALLVLMLVRVPVGIGLSVVALLGIWAIAGYAPAFAILSELPYAFTAKWELSAVPMFLLMGYICFHAGMTTGLFTLGRLLLSWLPGGLAVGTIGGAALFSAVSGSSVACAAAMGRIAIPEMVKEKYNPAFASATVAAAGTIGSLIPPSILLIVYGIFLEVSIGRLFLAAVIPGILTALAYALVVIIRVWTEPNLAPLVHDKIPSGELARAFLDTWPIMTLIIGVFGGLSFGLFSPTEAGAVGAALALIIALAQQRLSWTMFASAIRETLQTTCSVFLIIIGAHLLTRFMALGGLSDVIVSLVQGSGFGEVTILVAMAGILIVLGMFLDPMGIMLITLPIMVPIIQSLGIDLVWYGIFLVIYLEMAMISPPVGLNIFVIKGVVGNTVALQAMFRAVIPFIFANIAVSILIYVFPSLVLFLPSVLMP